MIKEPPGSYQRPSRRPIVKLPRGFDAAPFGPAASIERQKKMRQITKARMLRLRACPRCHGDLILDEDEYNRETDEDEYYCLQCGRRITVSKLTGVEREPLKLAS